MRLTAYFIAAPTAEDSNQSGPVVIGRIAFTSMGAQGGGWICLRAPAFLIVAGARRLSHAAFATRDAPLMACK
jgi:hypothetical protein